MKILSLDFETAIGKTIHGPTFRDVTNDIYTQIWATHPDDVTVIHDKNGFNRKLKRSLDEIEKIIGHNIGFDLCYIWDDIALNTYLLEGGKIWDTQLAEYILTGQQHTTASLAELQLKYLGVQEKPNRISRLYKRGIGADKIVQAKDRCPLLWKLYNEYCRTDGSTPLKIFKAQYIRAKKEGMLEIVELYNDYLLSIINMSCTGVKVDVNKCEHLFRDYNLKHIEYLKQAKELLTSVWIHPLLPAFNVNSPDHKSAVLFGGVIKVFQTVENGFYKNGNPRYKKEELAINVKGFNLPTSLTRAAKKEGMYSTDDKVLKAIKASPHSPKQVLEYCNLQDLAMKYKKAAKTYCQAFIERSVAEYLYPHFNNTLTPTGRLTSSEPNMQNIPSKSSFAKDLMGVLVAPPGWKCVAIDFSQLEKWVQALVSNDQQLIEKLESGACLHCVTLAKISGELYDYVYQKAKVEQEPSWDARRTAIKPVGFLMDYGGMAERIAKETGLPLDEVREIERVDRELYPDKYKFFEHTLPEAVKASATYSLACNTALSRTKGKDGVQFFGKAELLPIFDKLGNVHYNKNELRYVGYWSTNYGKKYHFTDNGRYVGKEQIRRGFSMPKFKNYPNQGGAADIQAATTAELLQILLTKCDKIKMLLEIHDSKLFYVREDVLEPCLKWLKETIENVPAIFMRRFGINVPFNFPVEIKVGDDFGTMEKYKI